MHGCRQGSVLVSALLPRNVLAIVAQRCMQTFVAGRSSAAIMAPSTCSGVAAQQRGSVVAAAWRAASGAATGSAWPAPLLQHPSSHRHCSAWAAAQLHHTSSPCSTHGVRGVAAAASNNGTISTVSAAAVPASDLTAPTLVRQLSSHIKMDVELLKQLNQPPKAYAEGPAIMDSIIKVYTVHSKPNNFLPWQNHPKRESTGTGFVVHDRLILTNAHVVADSTYVLVKRHGSGTKFKAEVQAVGHDCDLAILSVEDEAFWTSPTSMLPLRMGDVPALQQDVVVIGYPTGGDNTSVTSGVVSRVEVAQYVHAASHLMAIQIDAAINPGNSGGPALQEESVVGVAFQNLPHAENIGYIIPTPVVYHFLGEVAKYGAYNGYCSLGIMCQNLENPQLRRALGMPQGMTGVLVNTIQPTSAAAKVIKRGDVLLEFEGVPIANDGTVHLRHRERIYFSYLITLKPTGSPGKLKLLRDAKVIEQEVLLQPNDMLVPVHTYDRLPSYLIFAGMVFVPLTQPYLHEYGEDWHNAAPRRLYDKAMHQLMQKDDQQIVVMTQVLSDDVNTGYQQFQNLQVLRVNGVELLNLAHLAQLLYSPPASGNGNSDYVRFELEDERMMVVDRRMALEASHRISQRYRIPSLMSSDLAQSHGAHWQAATDAAAAAHAAQQ